MFQLKKGDKIALAAPSSHIDKKSLDTAVKWFTHQGFGVEIMPHILAKNRYMAGSARQRAEDINACFYQSDIKAVFCVRGGAGSTSILDLIDYEAVKKNPKPVFGLSDSTALQNALFTMSENISFSGFLPLSDLKNGEPNSKIKKSLNRIFAGKSQKIKSGRTLICGQTEGILVGGCLSVLCYLCGTKYFPDLSQKILLLEDVGEKTYKIDLMLNQLRQQPDFDKLNGIIFGTFTNCPQADKNDGSINRILQDFSQNLTIPVLKNFAYGHSADRYVLPIGGKIKLNATEKYIETY